jgi:RNA polymerase sigma-70 factor (ECF subfamily)
MASGPAPGNHPKAAATADWAELMRSAQEGDQTAYRALLSSVTPYLRALTRRAGLAPAEAEDVVQDILLTIHAGRQTYDPARAFAPWLVAIARHRLIDYLRQRGKRRARETELTIDHETFAHDETYGHEQESEARRLKTAIASLPIGQKQAVELVKLSELSLKEASRISGQSETALKVAVHRAIKRLQTILVNR